ncbi:MAG TPA: hypothetical protein VGV93_12095 [Acidimicrobiales bacterium]|nr:hypothetical protein [Acidimicrobiales bacterium]
MVDDDDPVKDAAREIAATARAVATGVAVAARAKAGSRASRVSEEARRLEARAGATGAWRGVQQCDRAQEVRPEEVEGALAEQRRRKAQREQELVRG